MSRCVRENPRHIINLFLPGNGPRICSHSCSEARLSSNGDRYLRSTKSSCIPVLTCVIGTVILMIGASLVGHSGAPNWAGGANSCSNTPATGIFALCPTIFAPRPLPWGSPEFIGLGFLSFISIVLTELFGSPFMKNISIIIGLAVGCIVAGAAGYIDDTTIKSAPPITFLWYRSLRSSTYRTEYEAGFTHSRSVSILRQFFLVSWIWVLLVLTKLLSFSVGRLR